MEKKIKKKKLTLSVSSSKPHRATQYANTRGKTSVIIPKKSPKRWGEKKFQSQDINFNKPKPRGSFLLKKTPINKNFDIRKMAEERATKIFKNVKEDVLQQKKSTRGKEKDFSVAKIIQLNQFQDFQIKQSQKKPRILLQKIQKKIEILKSEKQQKREQQKDLKI